MPLRFSIGILKSAPDSPRRPSVFAIPLESGSRIRLRNGICCEREERMMDGGC